MLSPVPFCGLLIDPIPAELLNNQIPVRLEQAGNPFERRVEVLEVVKRVDRYRRLEGPRLVKLLERGATEDWPFGSLGVDSENAVPSGVDCLRQSTGAAADLEHPCWKWWKGS